MGKKEKNIFDTYAVLYSNDLSEEDKKRIRCQKYMFKKINKEKISNTAVEKMLDIVLEEINQQYIRTEHIQSRAGFLIALWGLLLSSALGKGFTDFLNNMIQGEIYLTIFKILLLILLAFSAGGTFYYLCKCMFSRKLKRFGLEQRERYFRMSVDDKNISFVVLLEVYTNIWEYNELVVRKLAKNLNYAIRCLIFFVLSTVILLVLT